MKKIRELVRMVEDSEIAELEVSHLFSLSRIKIVKSRDDDAYQSIQVSTPSPLPMKRATKSKATEPDDVAMVDSESEDDNIACVVSPMVGTFYLTPTPDAEPFVKKGQKIQAGQVVCIVEAMKLMNEIESDYNGQILEILVENGKPVQYNQPLFTINISG